MPKNFGKTIMKPITIPPVLGLFDDTVMIPERHFAQQAMPDGTPWKDVAEAKEGTWFIAVSEDGFIMCCERDPTMCAVAGFDIWQIEHPGPDTAIRGNKWTGEEVEGLDQDG